MPHELNLNTPQLAPPGHCPAWFERLPFARWGWRELNLLRLAAARRHRSCLLLLGSPWCWLAIVPAVLLGLARLLLPRSAAPIPDAPDAIVAPADGTVVDVTPLDALRLLGGPAVRIGIFLSIFNVHINRAPFAGRVVDMHYKPGEFLNALQPESAERNEFMWIGFEAPEPPHAPIRRAADFGHAGPANRLPAAARTDGHPGESLV